MDWRFWIHIWLFLIKLLTRSSFGQIYLPNTLNPKPEEVVRWNFERMFIPHYLSGIRGQVSGVTCHVSPVTCHVSHGTCHMSNIKKKIYVLKKPSNLASSYLSNCYYEFACHLLKKTCISKKVLLDCAQIFKTILILPKTSTNFTKKDTRGFSLGFF